MSFFAVFVGLTTSRLNEKLAFRQGNGQIEGVSQMRVIGKALIFGVLTSGLAFPVGAQIMRPMVNRPLPKPHILEDEACLPWALDQIRGATVSVLRLQVPDTARSEFEKGCQDFRKKRFADAEEHVRHAIGSYSNYVAAWVMLGQVLSARQQDAEAHEACSRANVTDPTYLPPYLCLDDLDAHSGNWGEILNLTKAALRGYPFCDVYTYFYRAMAYLNLNQLSEAEKSAHEAEGIDIEHREAGIHFLLAEIYEAKGDLAAAVGEIRQFLKLNKDAQQMTDAKQYLAKLENQKPGN